VGCDTGFPKHGTMLRMALGGSGVQQDGGAWKLGAYSNFLQFPIDPSLRDTRMRQGTCPANHRLPRCSEIGLNELGEAQRDQGTHPGPRVGCCDVIVEIEINYATGISYGRGHS
jgi:hypothetical protein